jgi:hypothetical protein
MVRLTDFDQVPNVDKAVLRAAHHLRVRAQQTTVDLVLVIFVARKSA